MTYVDLCDELYADWLGGTLNLSARVCAAFPNRVGSTTDYCPEPYLVFGDQSDPLVILATNPGNGEPFQRRDAVDAPDSPLKRLRFADVAPRLGDFYATTSRISMTARNRVHSMRDVARRLGKTGVLQVQLLPFHSDRLDKSWLEALFKEPLLRDYLDALKAHLDRFDTVCAMANVFLPAAKDKPLVRAFGSALGVDPAGWETVPFKHKDDRPTIGVLVARRSGRIRTVWCSSAYNQPPGTDLRDRFVAALTLVR